MNAQDTWHDAAGTDAVTQAAPLGVVVSGTPVALFRLGAAIHALHDRCPHGSARLSAGFVIDGHVECPLHQGLVDIATGAARAAPVRTPARVYPVRIVGGRVEIALPAQTANS